MLKRSGLGLSIKPTLEIAFASSAQVPHQPAACSRGRPGAGSRPPWVSPIGGAVLMAAEAPGPMSCPNSKLEPTTLLPPFSPISPPILISYSDIFLYCFSPSTSPNSNPGETQSPHPGAWPEAQPDCHRSKKTQPSARWCLLLAAVVAVVVDSASSLGGKEREEGVLLLVVVWWAVALL